MSKNAKDKMTTTREAQAAGGGNAAVEVLTVEEVEARLASFQQAAQNVRDAIERDLREANEAERQAESLVEESDALACRGDPQGRDRILRQVGPLRDKARRLRVGLGRYARELGRLTGQVPELRRQAHQLVQEAEQEIEQAKVRHQRAAAAFYGISDHALHQARDLLDQAGALPKPAPAKPPAAEPAKPALPDCPRCRRNQRVEILGQGQFRCSAAWHGGRGLVFRATGAVISLGGRRTQQSRPGYQSAELVGPRR